MFKLSAILAMLAGAQIPRGRYYRQLQTKDPKSPRIAAAVAKRERKNNLRAVNAYKSAHGNHAHGRMIVASLNPFCINRSTSV